MNETAKTAYGQIGGGPDRFKLRRGPDGVYLGNRRMVPIREDGSDRLGAINDGQPIVPVHHGVDDAEHCRWVVLGVNVEQ